MSIGTFAPLSERNPSCHTKATYMLVNKVYKTIQGRMCVRDGNRWLAVPKPTSLTDRIALATTANLRTSWDRIMDSPQGGHVICNQERAHKRRIGRWSRAVTPAMFAGRS